MTSRDACTAGLSATAKVLHFHNILALAKMLSGSKACAAVSCRLKVHEYKLTDNARCSCVAVPLLCCSEAARQGDS